MTDQSAGPLIFALLLDGEGGARELTLDEVHRWRPTDGVRWVHLDHVHPETEGLLLELTSLEPFEARGLVEVETRPRVSQIANELLLTLRGVNLNPGADPQDMVSLRMTAAADHVVSLRHRKVMAVQDVRDRLAAGRGPTTSASMITAIANRLTDRMGPQIQEIEDGVDDAEERVLEDDVRDVRRELASWRRKAIALRRYVAPQRDVLTRLLELRLPWFAEADLRQLREVQDRVTRYVEDLDAVRERASVTQEELSQRMAESMNRTMYVLSIIAGIFLPLSLLTGLLGINVGGIPGADVSSAFIVVSVALVLIAAIELLIFRRMRWF
jgi:zinc transporter